MLQTTKITFKKTEAEWYNYHHTLKEIARLREEIMNPFEEDPDDPTVVKGANSVRSPGDPTERMATRLMTSKQLKYLNEVTKAIGEVYEALPDSYKRLVQLRYWSKHKPTWDGIAFELKVSERQARRWRNEIIQTTIKELGWR